MARIIFLAIPMATVLLTSVNSALTLPPPIPAVYPDLDQTKMITGAFLTAPLVADALAHVESVVSADILAIPPSTYISGSTVTYRGGANTCYWPANQCVRTAPTANFQADIVSCPQANRWGLTYDDGPTSHVANGVHTQDTAAIRNALNGLNVTATFFVCGTGVRALPDELRASFNAGHQIASHTWTHHPLTSLTNAQIVAELKYTEAAIFEVIGRVPTHFRPPYGDVDDRVRAIASALGYKNVLWNVDSNDASGTNDAAAVLNTIQSWFTARPGFISLEHDISTFTSGVAIQALAEVRNRMQAGTFPLTISPVNTCVGESGYWNGNNPTTAGSTVTSSRPASSSTSSPATSTTSAPSTFTTSATPTTTATPTRVVPTSATVSKDITSGAEVLTSYLGQLVLAGLAAIGLQLL